ncbi:MAG: phosphoenolpyruvate synthase [Gemmatimonadetes bacterium]|nr:phosphoenolpyruvate synthase [Gemmatimonadota bacterium]
MPASPSIPSISLVWTPTSTLGLPNADDVGGKALNLARLVRAGARVPAFFVIPTPAFDSALGALGGSGGDMDAERLRAFIESAGATDERMDAILAGLATLGEGGALAVRSSAVGEDGGAASYAGQFDTVLGVRPEVGEVWDAVRRVWASAFSTHAAAYRRTNGGGAARMAVIVQRLVDPEAAGVAFSVDPVAGDAETAVVSAVYGLGEGLVGGALDADTYRARFHAAPPSVSADLARKDRAVRRMDSGGTAMVEVAETLRDQPALTDGEALRIARHARDLARAFGAPQDVEWALAPGADGPRTLWTLQTRPVTAFTPAARPLPGERRTWDNENVVEPFPGVTLPLSFSVARHAMGQIFVAYAEVMGAPPAQVDANRAAVAGLFGLIRGRVYFDLHNYRRTVAMVPGFALQGGEVARVPLPADPPGTPAPMPGALSAGLLLAAKVLGLPARLLRETARIEGALADFRRRAAETLDPPAAGDMDALTVDELRGAYERIDRGLVLHWHGPMLNDGLLDLWMTELNRVAAAWLPDAAPGLVNALIAGEGGMVSTEPIHRLDALVEQARADTSLRALLAAETDDAEAWRRLTAEGAFAAFCAELRRYLAEFGDRCAHEMKLEATTYADDPAALVAALRARVDAPQASAAGADGRGARMRAEAEAWVRERLAQGRQVAFFAVLDQVRRQVRERESTRFQRTRSMGIIRRIFLAIGARLAQAGALDAARDVLYLTKEELFAFLDGTSPGALRPLSIARRAEFDAYARMPEPPERFTTAGPPALAVIEPVRGAPAAGAPDGGGPNADLRGTGCCAGVARAQVRVVHDPRDAGGVAGAILVARQTDPGWTLLFAGAAGVLVQRGSLLSHAAIVAREMGIPCIVGIPGLLDSLVDGETVEMDGAAGTIRRLSSEG